MATHVEGRTPVPTTSNITDVVPMRWTCGMVLGGTVVGEPGWTEAQHSMRGFGTGSTWSSAGILQVVADSPG